ncbi:delta-latroinsectotoxin-Lt1a-like [Sipha flava]|uniref:Delta-latroinsectotoxin-Lt1a-like n=1 Tax=Sipha flava TaxID=143950 RepID=A0A8B8G8Q5_9HEMI|nr:delta-latroinsectotoxin-Lt1a-like [Sipha flava]
MLQANPLDKLLIDAVESADIEKVKHLLNEGANPNAIRLNQKEYIVNLVLGKSFLPQFGIAHESNHISALGYAINLAHTEIATLLIDNGADFNGYSHSAAEITHLHNASALGRIEIVKLLLGCDIDTGARNIGGYTALHSAVRSFDYFGDGTKIVKEIVNLLLNGRVAIDAQDKDGKTALHIAATYKRVEITELLLDRGAADVKDRDGNTALHDAATSIYNNAKTVSLLLKYNLDVNAKNKDGKTPISAGLKNKILPSDPTLKADVLFTFLIYGATLNDGDRDKINKEPDLRNCLTAFEKIKAMPHWGNLIGVNGNRSTSTIVQYINDENKGQELIEEFKNIKKDYSSQEFIHESFARNLRYFAGVLKEGERTKLLSDVASSRILSYITSNRDLNNLNLAYFSDITGSEYDKSKTPGNLQLKQEAFEEYKQSEAAAANALLDKLKSCNKESNLLQNANSSQPHLQMQKVSPEEDNLLQNANSSQSFSASKQAKKTSPIKKAMCSTIPFIAVGIYTAVVLYYDTTLDPIIAAGIFIGAAVFVAACFAVMKICEKKAELRHRYTYRF